MAKLQNVSSQVQYVGGWQGRQVPPGHVIRIKLEPGEMVDIPEEVLHDPDVRKLAQSADFKLVDVALVAGGPIDADPALKKGEAQLLRKTIAFGDLANLAVASSSIGLGSLPSGTVIQSLVLRLDVTFDDGGGNAISMELGSAADPDSLMVSEDLGVAAARIVPARSLAVSDVIDAGIDLEARLVADLGTLDGQTAGSVEILLAYYVC
jgi:hypothetical protein